MGEDEWTGAGGGGGGIKRNQCGKKEVFDGECGRTNRTFIDDRNALPWKKRGDAGGAVARWPSEHEPAAMTHYAGIMKTVLLGHTPH